MTKHETDIKVINAFVTPCSSCCKNSHLKQGTEHTAIHMALILNPHFLNNGV